MATYLTRKNAIIYSHFQKYLLIHREISYKMATYRNRGCVIIYENWYMRTGIYELIYYWKEIIFLNKSLRMYIFLQLNLFRKNQMDENQTCAYKDNCF